MRYNIFFDKNYFIVPISSLIFFSNIFKKISLSIPGSIGCKKDIVILPGYFINPIFGQTLPEFKATGTQGILRASYILPAPF